jgi:hypothetical protein
MIFMYCIVVAYGGWSQLTEATEIHRKKINTRNRHYVQYFSPHDLCESEIVRAERVLGIPKRLLLAIGTVESGRSSGDKKRPWPWTICANGRGYYFSTKSAAIAAVKKLMARGTRNIDVGCMQVNLLHHSKAFKTLEEAFTPRCNVKYGAKYLLSLRQMYHTWTNAVGYYHSKAEKYYKPYCNLVYSEWRKVSNRIINYTPMVQQAAMLIKSNISYIPSYYSLMDSKIFAKLHKLGRQSLHKKTPRFLLSK